MARFKLGRRFMRLELELLSLFDKFLSMRRGSFRCILDRRMPRAVSASASGSAWRVRCFEIDSPGSRPLPSHSSGASISVEGLEKLAGREPVLARHGLLLFLGGGAAIL